MNRPFPVTLVCPACGARLAPDAACACPAGTRLSSWNGVPRLLSGRGRGDETAAEELAELLRLMDSTPWKRALEEAAPNDGVRRGLADAIGPDFIYAMPWDELETVLDVGSGMGRMAAALAALGKTVVAVEPVPERALFQLKRAAQDGFPNWHPVIAAPAELPFPPGSFDLVALSGTFDSVRLEDVVRLLKPDGYLYAGIENRLALRAVLGRFGLSGRARANGGRPRARMPGGYERLLTNAGFERVEVFGAFDGFERQMAVYRLGDSGARRVTRELVDPPVTRKGRLLRRVLDAAPWRAAVEDAFVVFARKSSKDGRLAWSGLPHDGPVTQFSSSDKVFALCFDGEPSSVLKSAKTSEAGAILAREHAFLQAASRRHGAEAAVWPLRWPNPLGIRRLHGRSLYHYEFARGSPLSRELQPLTFDLERFGLLLTRLIESYVDLCVKMTAALPADSREGEWDVLLDRLAEVRFGDADCDGRIAAACGRLRARRWPTHVTHGDLSLTNALLLPDGGIVLVDWESAGPGGLIAIDLARLLHDVRHESALLEADSRREAMSLARRAVRDAFERLGIGREDYADVEMLFVAHQFHLWLLRYPHAATTEWAKRFLRDYRAGEFELADAP